MSDRGQVSSFAVKSRKTAREVDTFRLLYLLLALNREKGKPRQIEYPLKKRRSTILTKELYINSAPDQNTIPNDRNILYNGHYLRSKNELIVCEALNNLGYEFKTFDPDVTYYIPEIEKPVSLSSMLSRSDDSFSELSLLSRSFPDCKHAL